MSLIGMLECWNVGMLDYSIIEVQNDHGDIVIFGQIRGVSATAAACCTSILEGLAIMKHFRDLAFLVCVGMANIALSDITSPSAGTDYVPGAPITVTVGGDDDMAGLPCVIEAYKKNSSGEWTIVMSSVGIIELNELGGGIGTLNPPIGQQWPTGDSTLKIVAKVQGSQGTIPYGEVIVDIVP